jgi:hypothetical protein
MRMPKAGDKVICLEDESLATVVSLTAGGSPDIVFSDGSRGTYLLREFAELFGYAAPPAAAHMTEFEEAVAAVDNTLHYAIDHWQDRALKAEAKLAQPEQEPVAWMFQHGETGRMSFVSNDGMNNPELFLAMNPRYALVCALVTPPAAQRTWVGLTDAELADMHATLMVKLRGCYETKDLYRAIEQRLKEKNNG